MSAIGDQYNFCIKRAGALKKCTAVGKRNCTNGQDASLLKCARMCSDCTARQIAQVVRISNFPALAVGVWGAGEEGVKGWKELVEEEQPIHLYRNNTMHNVHLPQKPNRHKYPNIILQGGLPTAKRIVN